MAKSIKPGILCLEGDWVRDDPSSRMTIEPALELLERMDFVTLHHRNVKTIPELWRHVDDTWLAMQTHVQESIVLKCLAVPVVERFARCGLVKAASPRSRSTPEESAPGTRLA